MVSASFAFWMITSVINDSDFAAFTFFSRFTFGFGAGLLRSVLLVSRAQSNKGRRDVQARDYLKWNLMAEAFGFFLGPLLLVITNHNRWENKSTTLWLAVVNLIVWFLFTLTFAENLTAREQ